MSEGLSAKPGDFDFLAGQWKIDHRRLPAPGQAWDVFTGEATCWTILNGAGSVEELRIPERSFLGMGLRLLEAKREAWIDYWVNARDGGPTWEENWVMEWKRV